MVMEMFEVKSLCAKKVDINPVMMVPVTGDNMSSMVSDVRCKILRHAGEALDGMGMTEEMQLGE